MSAVITALVGLLGVLVGVLLSSRLQYRNWQAQELAKVYAELFAAGDESMRAMNCIYILSENLASEHPGLPTAQRAAQQDPDAQMRYNEIRENDAT